MKRLKVFVLCCLALTMNAQEVIKLYPGVAPGSESWTWQEFNAQGIIFDVTTPTLTFYPAEQPNGIGLVICPGGAFHMLSFALEGENLAKFLNTKGVTCFVLKYRLCHAENLMERMAQLDAALMDSVSNPVIPLALQDAMTAIRYIRTNAAKYGVDPHRIGIEGSSAGGAVALGTAMAATGDSRPDFVVGTYPYNSPHIGKEAPTENLPLFLAAASDDSSVPVQHSIDFYTYWHKAGYPAEMHLYKEGEHGFVGKQTGMVVDTWQDRLAAWLETLYPKF